MRPDSIGPFAAFLFVLCTPVAAGLFMAMVVGFAGEARAIVIVTALFCGWTASLAMLLQMVRFKK